MDECPYCALRYKDFRTGLTFKDVKALFWTLSDDPADWKYCRRHTVLGKWHQIKKEMWELHLKGCKEEHDAQRRRVVRIRKDGGPCYVAAKRA